MNYNLTYQIQIKKQENKLKNFIKINIRIKSKGFEIFFFSFHFLGKYTNNFTW